MGVVDSRKGLQSSDEEKDGSRCRSAAFGLRVSLPRISNIITIFFPPQKSSWWLHGSARVHTSWTCREETPKREVVLAFSRPPFLFRTSCIPYFFDSYPIYFILIFKREVARPLFCPFDHLRPVARTLAALRFPSPLFSPIRPISPILPISPPLFSPILP